MGTKPKAGNLLGSVPTHQCVCVCFVFAFSVFGLFVVLGFLVVFCLCFVSSFSAFFFWRVPFVGWFTGTKGKPPFVGCPCLTHMPNSGAWLWGYIPKSTPYFEKHQYVPFLAVPCPPLELFFGLLV